jgi:putative ATP-dependent endonuclease of OLD family
VTDLDNRPDDCYKFDEQEEEKKNEKIKDLQKALNGTNIKICVAKQWTLEWCLFKSSSLSTLFKKTVSEVHNKTVDFKDDSKFETKLKEKLKDRSLDKVAIANRPSEEIENVSDLNFNNDEYVEYLINAIKHVSENNR